MPVKGWPLASFGNAPADAPSAKQALVILVALPPLRIKKIDTALLVNSLIRRVTALPKPAVW